MKKFLFGCIVGGYVTGKVYEWFLKNTYDMKEKPQYYYTMCFNNLYWEREENALTAIETLKERSEETGYLSICAINKLFKLNTITEGKLLHYATTHGLTHDDICKITVMKSVTKGGRWRLNFHDGLYNDLFNHFVILPNADEDQEEKQNEH